MSNSIKSVCMVVITIVLAISAPVESLASRMYFGDEKLTVEMPDNYYVVSSYGVSDKARRALEERGVSVEDLLKENRANNWIFQAISDTFSVTCEAHTDPIDYESVNDITDEEFNDYKDLLKENFKSRGLEYLNASKYETKYATFLRTDYRTPFQGNMYDSVDFICIEHGLGYCFSFMFFDISREAADKRDVTKIIDSIRIDKTHIEETTQAESTAAVLPETTAAPKADTEVSDTGSNGNQVLILAGVGVLAGVIVLLLYFRKKKKEETPGKSTVGEENVQETEEGYYFANQEELITYGKLHGADGHRIVWLRGDDYVQLYKTGYGLVEKGQYDDAIDILKDSLRLNPVGIMARFEICEAYIRLKKYQDAKKTLIEMREFLFNNEDIARFYRRLGYIETETGNYELANACYRHSLKYAEHESVERELRYLKAVHGFDTSKEVPALVLKNNGIPIIPRKM